MLIIPRLCLVSVPFPPYMTTVDVLPQSTTDNLVFSTGVYLLGVFVCFHRVGKAAILSCPTLRIVFTLLTRSLEEQEINSTVNSFGVATKVLRDFNVRVQLHVETPFSSMEIRSPLTQCFFLMFGDLRLNLSIFQQENCFLLSIL